MTLQIILFWTAVGVLVFGFALAVQMRVMVARVLKIALEAHDENLDEAEARQVVSKAADISRPQAELPAANVSHLQEAHPAAINHLRLARKATRVLPPFVFLLLVLGKKMWGIF